MNNRNDISEELKNMGSSLADMPRIMPYTMPDGYAKNFRSELADTIKSLDEKNAVSEWAKTIPYLVPAGYFEGLADSIIDTIDIEDISGGLPKELPLIVPPGYFKSLPDNLLLAAKTNGVKKQHKQMPLKPKNTFPAIRWAAAAVLLICISLGSYITFFHSDQSGNPERILASVSTNEIRDYFQHTYRLDASHIVNSSEINNMQLDNKDIIEYLNETDWDGME